MFDSNQDPSDRQQLAGDIGSGENSLLDGKEPMSNEEIDVLAQAGSTKLTQGLEVLSDDNDLSFQELEDSAILAEKDNPVIKGREN